MLLFSLKTTIFLQQADKPLKLQTQGENNELLRKGLYQVKLALNQIGFQQQ